MYYNSFTKAEFEKILVDFQRSLQSRQRIFTEETTRYTYGTKIRIGPEVIGEVESWYISIENVEAHIYDKLSELRHKVEEFEWQKREEALKDYPPNHMKLTTCCSLMEDWEWLEDEKGNILHKNPASNIYSAILVKYAKVFPTKQIAEIKRKQDEEYEKTISSWVETQEDKKDV